MNTTLESIAKRRIEIYSQLETIDKDTDEAVNLGGELDELSGHEDAILQIQNHESRQSDREISDALYKALKLLYHTINGNSNPPKYAQIAIAEAKKALKLVDGIIR